MRRAKKRAGSRASVRMCFGTASPTGRPTREPIPARSSRPRGQVGGNLDLSQQQAHSGDIESVFKGVYSALAIMNYPRISRQFDSLMEDLKVNGLAILFDEWSEFDLQLQPLFAEMLRSTLLTGVRATRSL